MQKRGAYYNEIDPYCVQWLRNLIKAGHIAPGDVDERDIRDVCPNDLRGYAQCHFFAGIGVWSYALRRAGWADDREAWTGSCPCQPFSVAGLGGGLDDERHLWPFFHHLIRVERPAVVFGEQVASKDADVWIDLVQDDMEALGYAFGAVPFPSAGVGAPHIRDRDYWVADAQSSGSGARLRDSRSASFRGHKPANGCCDGGLADAELSGTTRYGSNGRSGKAEGRLWGGSADSCEHGGLANADHNGQQERRATSATTGYGDSTHSDGGDGRPGPTNGYWRTADWLGCTDGKWRPVEARVQQVVDGIAVRVGPLCSDLETKIKEVINEAAQRLQTEAGEILRTLREAIASEDIFDGRGGIFSVHEAQILLAYLLEYAGQERTEPNSIDGAGARSGAQRDLRMLWRQRALSDPSRQRELARQPLRELANTLRLLSSAVARFASEAGYQNLYKDAPASFPLGEILYPDSMGELRPKNRVGRLRAYGNAINAEAAIAFIETVMECLP